MKSEVESQELTFFGTDPGAVKFGNFINYYSFHNVEERTNHLHPDMFPKQLLSNNILCLDIGCNTGDLTKELYTYLKTIYQDEDIHILGIDIDPTLIQRAQELNNHPNITFLHANIMEDNSLIQKYLSNEKNKFDMTFCFSVTMWIHLNNGDKGLIDFLNYIKSISKAIIIEPQPWNCYRNAQRRLKKSGNTFQYYENLKIRSDVDFEIEKILLSNNFNKVYESPDSSWKRKIQSYHSIY